MRRIAAVVWGLGLLAVALQAAALATQYFQPSLNADYLYPQRFAESLWTGIHPLSGSVHSPAPYFFPDMAAAVLLAALTHGAPILPYYVIGSFVALALVSGWSLWRAGCEGWSGWLAGVTLVNGLLACRGFADHQMYLWWLGTAGYHGGTVLAGLAQFALWAGPVGESPGRGRAAAATALLLLGLVSDTLLLVQFVVPLLIALGLDGQGRWSRTPRLRSLTKAMGLALAGVAIFRVACALVDYGSFAKLVRYAPLPGAVVASAGQFGQDIAHVLWPKAGIFVAAAILGSLALFAVAACRRGELSSAPVGRRQAVWFAAAVIICSVGMPLVTAYWRSHFSVRYLLPCMVIPAWGLFAGLLSSARDSRLVRFGAVTGVCVLGIGFAVGGVLAAREVRPDAWEWPYPESVAALDKFLSAEGCKAGLADYWNAHLVTRLSREGVRLNQLRPDGRTYFWNNNAFIHYAQGEDGRLHPLNYRFAIVDGLDARALAQKFGEPSRRARVGGLTVWLYDSPENARLNQQVDLEVRAFLDDRPGTERIVNAAPK